jgi:hypothetical protein
MTEESHQVLFTEVDLAVQALDELRSLGVAEKDMDVISGLPFSHHILGRSEQKSHVPRYAVAGFLFGFVVSLLLNFGTPLLYPIIVGAFPLLSVPPTIILTFEISMLGLMVFTFFGVIWENQFPKLKPLEYSKKISDGQIAILFRCPIEMEETIMQRLEALGGQDVGKAEVMQ